MRFANCTLYAKPKQETTGNSRRSKELLRQDDLLSDAWRHLVDGTVIEVVIMEPMVHVIMAKFYASAVHMPNVCI